MYDAGLTMTSIPRLVNTLNSCKYVVANNIPGDFVECGVWRGGQAILAKLMFEKLGSNKSVWMFDTFTGMTAPTEPDIKAKSKVHAGEKFKNSQQENHNSWCYASLEDVKNNCIKSNLNLDGMKFVQGDVCKTLAKKQNLPEQISILRLDTDWYESTKAELEVLYPILSAKGVLIIDDYGSWEGARKAVDEYFNKNDQLTIVLEQSSKMLQHPILENIYTSFAFLHLISDCVELAKMTILPMTESPMMYHTYHV